MKNLFLILYISSFFMYAQNINITYSHNLIIIHDFSLKKNKNLTAEVENNINDYCFKSGFRGNIYDENKIKIPTIEQIPITNDPDRVDSFIYYHEKHDEFSLILYSNEYISVSNNFHDRLTTYLLLVSKENKQNSYVKIHDTYEDFSYPPKLLTYFIYNNYFLIVKVENYAYDQADPGPTGEDYYYEIVKIDKEKGLIKLNKNQSISIMNKYFKKRLEDFYYRR